MPTPNTNLNSLLADIVIPNEPSKDSLIDEEGLDDIAWHDFSQYEFLMEHTYYVPPEEPETSSGGSLGPIAVGDIHVHIYIGDGGPFPCPGGPYGLCLMKDMFLNRLGPGIDPVEAAQFAETISKSVSHAIAREFNLKPNEFPAFAFIIKAAFESALITSGSMSSLYSRYALFDSPKERTDHFIKAFSASGRLSGAYDVIKSGWSLGDDLLLSVTSDIDRMVYSAVSRDY